MMTASAEQNMETGSADQPLDRAEILRLVKASRQAGFHKSQEDYFAPPEEFRSLSLKEMAKINSQNAKTQPQDASAAATEAAAEAAPETMASSEEAVKPENGHETDATIQDQPPAEAADLDVADQSADLDAEDESLPPPADASPEDSIDSIGEQVNMAAQTGDAPQGAEKASFDEIKAKMDAVSKLKPENDTAAESADYQRGVEDGRKAALAEKEQEMSDAIAAFRNAAEAISHDDNIDLSQLSSAMNKAIITLASERAGIAIDSHPEAFSKKIETMVKRVRNRVDEPVIHLHPADAELISDTIKDNLAPRAVKIIADDQLKRGDARIDVGSIGVMDLIDTHGDDTPDTKGQSDD